MTESSGGVAAVDPDETERHGSVGRLMANVEAKIVDPETGEVLPPAHQGELWLRGPTIMKGDVCLCLDFNSFYIYDNGNAYYTF